MYFIIVMHLLFLFNHLIFFQVMCVCIYICIYCVYIAYMYNIYTKIALYLYAYISLLEFCEIRVFQSYNNSICLYVLVFYI